MSYREGFSTLKLSEPTTLRDIALTMSYIPSSFKTPRLRSFPGFYVSMMLNQVFALNVLGVLLFLRRMSLSSPILLG